MSNAASVPLVTQSQAGLHICAVTASVCAMAGVLTGAIVTSSGGAEYGQLHQIIAGVSAAVIAVAGIWMVTKASGASKRIGLWLLIALAISAALGLLGNGPTVATLHACMAQVLFAITAAGALATGSSWQQPPDRVEDHGWPSLGSLGKITPVLVLLQVAVGAAFRHKAMGVLPHLFGAMVLVLVILCVCIFVMQQFPSHAALRPASNLLMTIAFTQIFLGIGAFTVRSMTTKATNVVIWVTAAHVCVGAMTLAAATVLNMQIQRNVFKKAPSEDE